MLNVWALLHIHSMSGADDARVVLIVVSSSSAHGTVYAKQVELSQQARALLVLLTS